MSEENVEIVRQYIDEINRGRDWAAAGAGFMADDIEIDWSRSPAPYRGIYRGREEALRFAEELAVWEGFRIEPKEFIAAGDDVLVPHVVHLRGRDGLEVKVRATYVYTVRDGRCVRWRIYQEHADALEAAGLSE
jgi:ketosteroid isomerase-like protein